MNTEISTYNDKFALNEKSICNRLAQTINDGLPEAESKVWHGHPVWFLDSNPITGYAVRKESVQLLFWSGQSFDEPGLKPEGSFKAAEVRYTSPEQIDVADLERWLQKAKEIQWDYKNIVKRRGELVRLDP